MGKQTNRISKHSGAITKGIRYAWCKQTSIEKESEDGAEDILEVIMAEIF